MNRLHRLNKNSPTVTGSADRGRQGENMKFRFRKDLKIDIKRLQPQALLFMHDCILNDITFEGEEKQKDKIDVDKTLFAFQKHWLIPIKEKTEAEKWADSISSFQDKNSIQFYSAIDLKNAHTAGQKYAAAATHEIYNPLVEICKGLIPVLDWDIKPNELIKLLRAELEKINKNN